MSDQQTPTMRGSLGRIFLRWHTLLTIIAILLAMGLVGQKWLRLNRELIPAEGGDPVAAARSITLKYRPTLTDCTFQLINERDAATDGMACVLVRRADGPVGLVVLRSFLWFGWQERSFVAF